jgi:hydroxylamine reductase (hybrid-cluster protein)
LIAIKDISAARRETVRQGWRANRPPACLATGWSAVNGRQPTVGGERIHHGVAVMFCNQCEQASKGIGCGDPGVCGKDADLQSLQETLLYGVKGVAAYAHHARRLGTVDEEVDAFVEEALFATLTNVNFSLSAHLELVLECGRKNLRVMQMLDEAHTRRFGTPAPATVYEGTKAGPGILVTGHDLLDLADLLEQTAGTGINVYTHGEMLPAHAYPALRAHAQTFSEEVFVSRFRAVLGAALEQKKLGRLGADDAA